MLTGIDHVVIAVANLDAAAFELEASLGLRVSVGGSHLEHGTFNRLAWLGDSYIELMGVFDRKLAADSWWGSHVIQLLEGSDSAYAGLAMASDDLDGDIERLRAQGSPLSDPVAGQRARADGEVVQWRIGRLPGPDPDLRLVFLIEHDVLAAEWRPYEREARAAEVHPLGTPTRLARVELPASDLRTATMRLHRDLGLAFRPSLAGGGARDTSVGQQTLRLVRTGAPLIALRGGHEPRDIDLFNCRWSLEPISR